MQTSSKRDNAPTTASVPWVNRYQPATPPAGYILPADELYGPEPYDVNFCFPYIREALDTGSIRLDPLLPRIHGEGFYKHVLDFPQDFQYMRFPLPKSYGEFLTWFEYTYRRNPGNMAYAMMVIDEAGEERLGGVISLTGCDPDRLISEISMGMSFRGFRGGSAAAIVTSLLLRYCLSLPTDSPPGLGLRKVGWTAHSFNYPSQALARTIGMRVESMQRWSRVAQHGKKGNDRPVREGDPLGLPGIDDYYCVLCWDDWETEGKRHVEKALSRRFRVVESKL